MSESPLLGSITLYVIESGSYYDNGDGGVVSVHFTYEGALSPAGRAMSTMDYSDPYGLATKTRYHRIAPYNDALDEWKTLDDDYLTLRAVKLER